MLYKDNDSKIINKIHSHCLWDGKSNVICEAGMDEPAGERGLPAAGHPAAPPSPSLSPVDSSLPGREPPAEAIAHFGDRVNRIPTAAQPLSHQSILRLCRGPSPKACMVEDYLTYWEYR